MVIIKQYRSQYKFSWLEEKSQERHNAKYIKRQIRITEGSWDTR